jgi:spore germination protein GerM
MHTGPFSKTLKGKLVYLKAVIILCVLSSGLMGYAFDASSSLEKREEEVGPSSLPIEAEARAHLYFLDETRQFLKAEERILKQQKGEVDRAKTMIDALIEGPKSGLLPTLPAETKLLALYIAEDGVAYVDFSKAITEKHPGGILTELFTIFSVVNTLTLNLEKVERVKILIGGKDAPTLAGHIDIRFPFGPNVLMIK